MFILGAALRVALIGVNGYPGDISTFERWMQALATAGPSLFYADQGLMRYPPVDYVPGYPLILWPVSALYVHIFGPIVPLSGFALAAFEKLPAIVADLVLAGLTYRLALRVVAPRMAALASAAILFAPTFWLVSAVWGQVDSIAVVFVVAAMWCMLSGRSTAAWIMLACALLLKPQPLAVAPIFLMWELRRPHWLRHIGLAALAAIVISYAVSLPFAPSKQPGAVFSWLISRYLFGYEKYPWVSFNAWNLYGVGSMNVSDARHVLGVPLRAWGVLLTAALVFAIAARLWRALVATAAPVARERWFLVASTAALATPYMLATRMHERYLLFALAPASIVATFAPELLAIVAALTALFALNCAYVLFVLPTGAHPVWMRPLLHVPPLSEVALYVLLLAVFFTGRGFAAVRPLASRPAGAETRAAPA